MTSDTNNLDPVNNVNPTPPPTPPPANQSNTYSKASLVLYRALSGDRNVDRTVTTGDENFDIDGSALSPPLTQLPTCYFAFKPNMLGPSDQTQNVQYIRDTFGDVYGYSTMKASDPTKDGYNPTFDLWSTAGTTSGSTTDKNQWIKNW